MIPIIYLLLTPCAFSIAYASTPSGEVQAFEDEDDEDSDIIVIPNDHLGSDYSYPVDKSDD